MNLNGKQNEREEERERERERERETDRQAELDKTAFLRRLVDIISMGQCAFELMAATLTQFFML